MDHSGQARPGRQRRFFGEVRAAVNVPDAISSSGVIVGSTYGENSNGDTFNDTFTYTGGRFEDLNSLIPAGSGFVLTGASGINNSGQIIASATDTANGTFHALLPDPS